MCYLGAVLRQCSEFACDVTERRPPVTAGASFENVSSQRSPQFTSCSHNAGVLRIMNLLGSCYVMRHGNQVGRSPGVFHAPPTK